MAQTTRTVRATVAVRVPVNAAGSLADGAARIVERIDAVDRVDAPEVRGIQPGLNDTVVDVRVRVALVGDRDADVARARRVLADGVGVRDVDDVETVEPDGPPEPTASAG